MNLSLFSGFFYGSAGKETTCTDGDLGSISGLGRSAGEGKGWLPNPVFWPWEFHRLYSPWGPKSQTLPRDIHFQPFFTLFPRTNLSSWSMAWEMRTLPFHGLIAYILDHKTNVETVSTVLAIAKYMCAGSCLTLCDPLEGSQPGSSVCGILPARILEWVEISSSRWFSWPRDWTRVPGISCIVRKKYYTPIKILF